MNETSMIVSPFGVPLVPSNMREAMELATMMSKAKLVPAALQGSPSDCLMVVLQAQRWGMDAFAVAQECSVIQGKLMHSGKLTIAVINTRAPLMNPLEMKYSGEGEARCIDVIGKLSGDTVPRSVRVEWKNAKTTNAMWTKQPDQQLAYHGARVWARRYVPELMLGVFSPEEMETPQPPRDITPPTQTIEHVDADGVVTERPATKAPQQAMADPLERDWPKVGTWLAERVAMAPSTEKLKSLLAKHGDTLSGYATAMPEKYAALMQSIVAREAELANAEQLPADAEGSEILG